MVIDQFVRIGALLVDGLSLGLLYAILGLAITLVFGLGGVLNLALGVFSTIALLILFELAGVVPIVVADRPRQREQVRFRSESLGEF